MGKWDHRPSRRLFRRQTSPGPPPKFYDIKAPLPEFWQDGIPLWEKKYCTLIGPVPWQKIVDSKKFMYYHNNVLSWNDSAAEEAFQNAKKRYWAKINSLPCDISPADPDTYIDQIDWNPYLDPELIKELDREYFSLPDEEQGNAIKNKRTKISVNGDNPWESTGKPHSRALDNKVQGWNQGDNHVDDSGKVDNTDNPWECSITHTNGRLTDNAWEAGGVKSWAWNDGIDHNNHSRDWDSGYSPWGNDCVGILSQKDNGWGKVRDGSWNHKSWAWNEGSGHNNHSRDWDSGYSPWGNDSLGILSVEDKGWSRVRDSSWNQQMSNNSANIGKPWDCKSSQQNGAQISRGWRNSRANVSGWRKQENTDVSSDLQFKRNHGSWTARNQSFQKKEGSNLHTLGYKGSQFQKDDRQAGHYWMGEKSKKRVSFARD